MGKGRFSFTRRRRQTSDRTELLLPAGAGPPSVGAVAASGGEAPVAAGPVKGKKKAGSRLWIRYDRLGRSELIECDKNAIIRLASIPARDLRILGPVFSHSSNILAREKAMVVNLEFVKAIVTAEEVLVLDPLSLDVRSFVDQLRQQLPLNSPTRKNELVSTDMHEKEGLQSELPFEFQVLEIALEVVCSYLDARVTELETEAYPVLDELAKNVSTKNLEMVRNLKSNLTQILARVQKVRNEIEHLLDDNEDMSDLYLTRKQLQQQQFEALVAVGASNSITPVAANLSRVHSNAHSSASLVTATYSDENDVEDLEMLFEAYFMQLDGIRNKILSVREYIDDTEDYVNIQLDNQRNELIQLQLILTIASFALAVETLIAGAFGMNIPCQLYQMNGIFEPFVGGTSAACFLLFVLILGYARRKKLLGS